MFGGIREIATIKPSASGEAIRDANERLRADQHLGSEE